MMEQRRLIGLADVTGMKVLLYRDATVVVPLTSIAEGLSRIFTSIDVQPGRELVEIPGQLIRSDSYTRLPSHFVSEARSVDLAVVATEKRYENNFFYDTDDACIVLLSFANWESLTNLPISNGLVLFVAELIAESIRLKEPAIVALAAASMIFGK